MVSHKLTQLAVHVDDHSKGAHGRTIQVGTSIFDGGGLEIFFRLEMLLGTNSFLGLCVKEGGGKEHNHSPPSPFVLTDMNRVDYISKLKVDDWSTSEYRSLIIGEEAMPKPLHLVSKEWVSVCATLDGAFSARRIAAAV